jgi:hypothetical protein
VLCSACIMLSSSGCSAYVELSSSAMLSQCVAELQCYAQLVCSRAAVLCAACVELSCSALLSWCRADL